MLERSIVRPFSFRGKTAGRKLFRFYVIGDALATKPFAGAWFVRAVALLEVPFLVAFHHMPPLLDHRQTPIKRICRVTPAA